VRKLVIVILLVLFLLGPGVVVAEPIVCDYTLHSGKLLDWLVCVIVMEVLAAAEEIPGGWSLHYE
jgi:hypothetical protein